MSRPRYLADHNFHKGIVLGLRRQEPAIEIVRVQDLDLAESPDEVVLEFAANSEQIVLSHDFNTMIGIASQRIKDGKPMPGLFLTPQEAPLGPVIDDLLLIWAASEAEEWHHRIVFLPYKMLRPTN